MDKREDTTDVFTKVNRGGFREIRSGIGHTVKARTPRRSRCRIVLRATKDKALLDIVTKNGRHTRLGLSLIMNHPDVLTTPGYDNN